MTFQREVTIWLYIVHLYLDKQIAKIFLNLSCGGYSIQKLNIYNITWMDLLILNSYFNV